MRYKIEHVVVIGAGTMGAALAALLANAAIKVHLLDIVPQTLTPDEEKAGLSLGDRKVRNRIVQLGLDRALKSRPASFLTPEHASLVTLGNLEDDFDVIAKADWVIEAIVENLAIKRDLMARIDRIRSPQTIISTNTSGIPVASLAEGFSDGFRQHFLGTHFFNPPRYLKLLEVIPTAETSPAVVDFIARFGEERLGKGIVFCKDTPNFIANRLAFAGGAFAFDYILENGYTVEEVDAITGPPLGRPKTATFRLIDLVGIDVWEHVGRNLAPAISHDAHALKYLNSPRVNTLIHQMVENGWLGTKSRQGFYKEVKLPDGGKEFWALNLNTLEHEPAKKVRFDSLGAARDVESLGERLKILLSAPDRAGDLARALTYQAFAYASERIPEIADTPLPIDSAICLGFGHEAGPFETWDLLGVADSLEPMKQTGFPPAPWVTEMLERGIRTFYQYEGGQPTGKKLAVYNQKLGSYEAIPPKRGVIVLKEQPVIAMNPGASLVDLGDGVACVELHTKMNTLDDDIFTMILQGLDRTDQDFEALVISTDGENFSAGANLMMIVMGAQSAMWDQLDTVVRKFQDLNMRIRYFPRPVIVAPAGMALGGGAEIVMHAGRVVAAAELYTGMVEFGAGVIPAGGGSKEMIRRVINPAMRTQNADVLPFMQRAFEQIGLAKVATSAEEARQMGILSQTDRVTLNRSRLLAEAKREALHLATSGYGPPLPEKIYAAGRDALAALRVAVFMMKEGGYITEYETHIAGKLAQVLTGGDLSRPAWVDEQYILDLEREAFLSLCGEEKTRQRMWALLQTGKPLRN